MSQESKVQIDPFRPLELNQRSTRSLTGAPAKPTAKPRKPSRILRETNLVPNLNTPSIQKRKTNQIHKAKCDDKKVYYSFYIFVK